ANSMTVEFTRDNGATAGACVAVSATPPPTATPMPTPTATPSGADLVITSMQVLTNTAVTVNQPITVSVVIKNQGSIDVSSLSWAYLYGDPAAPPTIGVPGDDWAGVDTLLAGSQFTVTLNYPGFATPGDHVFYAQADTWNQINELNEANNVFGPITVTVSSGGGPVATATPTATAVPNPGGISGSTLLLINGDLVPIGQVALECRVGTTVIATTVSDATGAFDFGMTLPAGTYDVYGDVTVGNVLYTDLQVGVVVTSGSSTIISLILTP
ncbi:MAG: CARDB domain-containing protein, partial [Anaerolineae bacterium]